MKQRNSVEGLRVVLADDSLLVRDGLARILASRGVVVAGLARDGIEALMEVERTGPDIVMLDMRMPPSGTNEGVLAAEAIRREHPRVGILVFAQAVERDHAERLMRLTERGIGYILKDRVTQWDQLADALVRVAAGGTALDPLVVEALMRARRTGPREEQLNRLSDRERTVLALMAEGLTNGGIAERMFVGVRTVETHIAAVFEKLALPVEPGEHRRVLAVLEYMRLSSGVVSAEQI